VATHIKSRAGTSVPACVQAVDAGQVCRADRDPPSWSPRWRVTPSGPTRPPYGLWVLFLSKSCQACGRDRQPCQAERSEAQQKQTNRSRLLQSNSTQFNSVLPKFFKSIGWQSNEGERLRCNAAFARLNTESGCVGGGAKSDSISACWLGGGVSWRVEGLSLSRAR
jgi:hypothetical protein